VTKKFPELEKNAVTINFLLQPEKTVHHAFQAAVARKAAEKSHCQGLLFKAFDGHFTILPDFLVFFRSFF
jgi:hypothetical protein